VVVIAEGPIIAAFALGGFEYHSWILPLSQECWMSLTQARCGRSSILRGAGQAPPRVAGKTTLVPNLAALGA